MNNFLNYCMRIKKWPELINKSNGTPNKKSRNQHVRCLILISCLISFFLFNNPNRNRIISKFNFRVLTLYVTETKKYMNTKKYK